MDIQSILNSPRGDSCDYSRSAFPCAASARYCLASVAIPKRQKIAKDAPVFSEGNKIVGHVNYPPYEAGDDYELEARHREFRIFPLGQIHKKGVRHIPYNSNKKDFLDKTGRDAFEVFQYTYKRPGDEREYVVVWDYNVGLVRMTPFFKSCKFSKTVPAKALRENPGMKDISYSITGGALVCQGYWMPYQAAREIAATFCWDIRWALTPVFGNDFPEICRPPQHPCFAKFVINSQIVQYCTAETARFREEGASYQMSLPKTPSLVMATMMPFLSSPWEKQRGRHRDLESGYGSDVERSEKSVFSPQVSPRSQCSTIRFTPVNGTGSPPSPHTTYSSSVSSPMNKHPSPRHLLPTSTSSGSYHESFRTKRKYSKFAYSDCGAERVETPEMLVAQLVNGQDRSKSKVDCRAVEAAEALISMGVVARNTAAFPQLKRIRRNSRYYDGSTFL